MYKYIQYNKVSANKLLVNAGTYYLKFHKISHLMLSTSKVVPRRLYNIQQYVAANTHRHSRRYDHLEPLIYFDIEPEYQSISNLMINFPSNESSSALENEPIYVDIVQ